MGGRAAERLGEMGGDGVGRGGGCRAAQGRLGEMVVVVVAVVAVVAVVGGQRSR